MQSPRIGLTLVLEGVAFHYIWLKCLLGTVTIYFDILFWYFCLKMQKLKKTKTKTKKTHNLYFPILWVGRKRANFFLGLMCSWVLNEAIRHLLIIARILTLIGNMIYLFDCFAKKDTRLKDRLWIFSPVHFGKYPSRRRVDGSLAKTLLPLWVTNLAWPLTSPCIIREGW